MTVVARARNEEALLITDPRFRFGSSEKAGVAAETDVKTVAMHLSESFRYGTPVLTIAGEVDLLQSPALREVLAVKAAARCPALVLDLERLSFMDSSGLSELIAYRRRAEAFGGRVLIAAPPADIRELFAVTALDRFFRQFHSVEAACAEAAG